MIDPDFGWHLQTGNYYLAKWIPSQDIFTYTAAEFKWISHEWLNHFIIAVLYNSGGYWLVAGLFALVWTSALVIAGRKFNSLVLIFAAFSVLSFSGVRPVAWTVLFIAILERILNSKHKKLVYFMPLLFLFWANIHGSFALGLVFLGLWQIFSKRKLPWLAFLLSFAAVLINPYGAWIFEEVIRTAVDPRLRFRISEWQMIMLPILSACYMIIFVAFHLVFNPKPLKSLFSYPGMMLALSVSSIRHFPVFAVVSMRYMEEYFERFKEKIHIPKLTPIRQVIIFIIILLPLVVILYFGVSFFRTAQTSRAAYPDKAIAYLSQHGCKGNLFNSYNFGGYLIWKFPEKKVYIDGRMPSWKHNGVDYFENYTKVLAKDEFRREEFSKYNIGCVLLTKADNEYFINRAVPLGEQLYREGWQKQTEASSWNYHLYIKR